MLTMREYFLMFMFYSVLGWIIEVIYAYIMKKKISNRGFFIGPYCPIYGIGCLLIVLLLSNFKKYPIIVFILAILICSALEYFTSYIMEKLFKARWWDYTDTKYNINGRVCLDTMLPFGIIACIVLYLLHPFVMSIINSLSDKSLTIISTSLFVILLTDIVLSFNIVNNFKKTIKSVSLEDCTDDINKYIRELLFDKSLFHRRLLKAFPSGHAVVKKRKTKKD